MTETRENLLRRVVVDPEIQGGRPVIRGTRVPVARIVGALSAGADVAEMKEDYGLQEEDVMAALAYAARFPRQTQTPIPPTA